MTGARGSNQSAVSGCTFSWFISPETSSQVVDSVSQALWGSQSWLPPAFSRRSPSRAAAPTKFPFSFRHVIVAKAPRLPPRAEFTRSGRLRVKDTVAAVVRNCTMR
ncbi:hypothetical protein SBA4_1610018 [Candidatus Sulfopaludibacter sp. SbA4]|nr:hypothetical protein SBA4_1610018 [Candidatus Sulfopaludibacter sp. SbA4]